MTPYLILTLITVLVAYLARRYGSKGIQFLSLCIISLLLILFAGLRSYTVGTDTGTYISMLMRMKSFSNIWDRPEVGYNILMVVANGVSDNYAVLLTLIALIVVTCYMATIIKLTERYETGIFLFLTLGSYTFFFNGARQGIAAALCFFAIPYLLQRKPKQYFLLIGLAFTFHHTALLASALYFVPKSRVGFKQLAIVASGTVIMTIFLTAFVQLATTYLGDHYATYADVTEGGGHVMAAFLVVQGVFLYMLKDKAKDIKGYYPKLLYIYLIGLIPVMASVITKVNPSGIMRLSIYFSGTAILLWPMIFRGIREKNNRALTAIVFSLVTIAFFYLTTSTFSKLVPYRINTEFL